MLQFTEDTRFTVCYTLVAPNGHILTSTNTDTLPLPLTGSHIAQIPDNISDYGTVLRGLPHYPYLAFISKTPVFWHYPLNRLAIMLDTLEQPYVFHSHVSVDYSIVWTCIPIWRDRNSNELYTWETGPVDPLLLLCSECNFKVYLSIFLGREVTS